MTSILLVDDNRQFRTLLCEFLEYKGYLVRAASDGKKAIQLYRESPTDVIILDMFMPEMEGLETMRILSQEYHDAKIIAISGGGERPGLALPALNLAKQFGAFHILQKPFNFEDLLEKIQTLHPPNDDSES